MTPAARIPVRPALSVIQLASARSPSVSGKLRPERLLVLNIMTVEGAKYGNCLGIYLFNPIFSKKNIVNQHVCCSRTPFFSDDENYLDCHDNSDCSSSAKGCLDGKCSDAACADCDESETCDPSEGTCYKMRKSKRVI